MLEDGQDKNAEAISCLQEYVDTDISPVDALAQITIVYIKTTGLIMRALPVLQQGFVGNITEGEKLRGEYSFVLLHSKGSRRVAIRVGDQWEFAVEDVHIINSRTIKKRFSAPMHVEDEASNQRTFQELLELFEKDAVN